MSVITYTAPCPSCASEDAVWVGRVAAHYVPDGEPPMTIEVRCAACDAVERASRG